MTAAAVAAAGAAIVVHGFRLGVGALHGFRLAAFLTSSVAVGIGAFVFLRAARRRARLEAIADLLPQYRDRHRDEEFVFDEPSMESEPAERLPGRRAEIRAATRALLVSLEEEMRRETAHARRTSRPACRRARLRAARRPEPRRRRVAIRLVTSPS